MVVPFLFYGLSFAGYAGAEAPKASPEGKLAEVRMEGEENGSGYEMGLYDRT